MFRLRDYQQEAVDKAVSWMRQNSEPAVDLNGKRIDLGRYNTIEEAIAVRKKYEVEFKYYSNRDDVQ